MEPQAVPLPRTHIWNHLLRLTPSELQQWVSTSKGTSGIEGETEVSGIKTSRGHCPVIKSSPYRASKLANTV